MLSIRCGFDYLHVSLLLVGRDLDSPKLTVKFVTLYKAFILRSVLMV